jgi:phosphopantothenoylcysteine decarboxylase/phosphopantothenate--cysteine ligase
MDAGMYGHAATQANLAILAERGLFQIGPEAGHLASGLVAKGRMSEPLEILGRCRYLLSRGGPLAGQRVVVTAGGTQEPLDPVRVLSNRSSGKQGFALAQAALDAGAQVKLIAGPVQLSPPAGCEFVTVETAEQMQVEVLAASQDSHVLIMAAAVADFRPSQAAAQKIKKNSQTGPIDLEPNPDILQAVAAQRLERGWPKVVVGFAAETENLLVNAQAKLHSKRLDLLVANDVSATDAGFGVDTNRVTLLAPGQDAENLPLMSKAEVAAQVIQRISLLIPTQT